jgi:hypothetical protein
MEHTHLQTTRRTPTAFSTAGSFQSLRREKSGFSASCRLWCYTSCVGCDGGSHVCNLLTKQYIYIYIYIRSRHSAVGIGTGYGLDDRGVGVRVTVGLFRGEVKRLGREADHSPPTNTGVKKMWIYTSITLYAFMA